MNISMHILQITTVMEPQQGRQKDKAAIHFTHEEDGLAGEQENGGRHVPGHTCQHGDPVKMLLNRPKRSSLKKSSLIQPVLAGEVRGRDYRNYIFIKFVGVNCLL